MEIIISNSIKSRPAHNAAEPIRLSKISRDSKVWLKGYLDVGNRQLGCDIVLLHRSQYVITLYHASILESVMLNVIYNKHETPNFGFSIKGMRNEPDNGANQRLCLDAPIPFRSWVYFNKWRCLENWISVSLHQGLNPIWKLLSQWLISLNGVMSNIHSGYEKKMYLI